MCYTTPDMATIISVVNQKGGVGKTTTTVNVATYFAMEGKRVLLIDLDSQGNATSGMGIDPSAVEKSIYHVLVGDAAFSDIVIPTPVDRLFIAPANVDLAGAAVELVSVDGREFRLQQALQSIDSLYDIIIMDCPPSLGLLTINGLVASQYVFIPVQAEYYALEGLGQLLRTIELVKEHLQPNIEVLGAVLTMFDRRNRLAEGVFTDMYQHFPHKVFRTVIPRNVRLAEAPSYGKPIALYDPGSKGARAYQKLARELLITLKLMPEHLMAQAMQEIQQDQDNEQEEL